jgi:hypothetical protein
MSLAIKKTRTNLLKMHAAGILYNKYIVENNIELKNDVKDMIKKDVKAQWLVGDVLKQD